VLVKKEQQKLRLMQKQIDAEVIAQKMQQAKLDDEKEKQDKIKKYKDHLEAMKVGSIESFPKSNYLAKTGVAVVKTIPMESPLKDKQIE
jgi:hypothetical protein